MGETYRVFWNHLVLRGKEAHAFDTIGIDTVTKCDIMKRPSEPVDAG